MHLTPEHADESPNIVPAVLIPSHQLPFLNRSTSQNFLQTQPPDPEGYVGTIQVFHYLRKSNLLSQPNLD